MRMRDTRYVNRNPVVRVTLVDEEADEDEDDGEVPEFFLLM